MQKIGIGSATAVGLGAIIGAGIFVLSGTAIALAGSFALLAFVLVGIVALLVALVMGELSSIMPYAKGASYSYAYSAFGSEIAFITGILMYVSYATAISAVALGFGSYLSGVLGIASTFNSELLASLLIAVLAIVNVLGIRKAAIMDFGLVVIKIAILLAFVAFAILIANQYGAFSNISFNPSGFSLGSLFNASVAIFFAYSGFQVITTFVSRVRGGSRAAAKAILVSVVISIIVYFLVVLSLMLLVPPAQYAIGADPLAFALQAVKAPQNLIIVVDIGAIIATTSAALAMMLSASRIVYQISVDRLLPKSLRSFDRKRDVAVNGVLLSALIGVVMLFSGNIFVIASISNFGLIFSYIIACIALIHFRKMGRRADIRVPFYPYLPIIAIIAMLSFMLGMPREALLFGTILVLALIVAYYFLREVREKKVIRVKLFE